MKKSIKRYQNGNGISWADVGDAASYMIPIYGTYRSIKDAINDPSFANWGLAGLSFLGDLAYGTGLGAAFKGAKASSAASKGYLGVAKNYERLAADIAKEASKINPKSSAKALKKADNLADDAIGTWKTALDYRAIAAKERQGITRAVKDAGMIAAGSTAAFKGPKSVSKASELDKNKRKSSTLKKTLKKVTPSNGNLVKKRTEPFLYNNFLKKDGGIMKKLINKYQEGGTPRHPNSTNTNKTPTNQSALNTRYTYSDKEGYTGSYAEYPNGNETLHKGRYGKDPNGNTYFEDIDLWYKNNYPMKSDTVYWFTTPDGNRIKIEKGSRQYEWLRKNFTSENYKKQSFWDWFKGLFGYKYGGKLISKCLDGGQVNQNESSSSSTYEGDISRKKYINKYALSYLDFIFGKSDRYLEPDGALPGYEILNGLILDNHRSKDQEFIKFPEYYYDKGLKVDSEWEPKKLQTIKNGGTMRLIKKHLLGDILSKVGEIGDNFTLLKAKEKLILKKRDENLLWKDYVRDRIEDNNNLAKRIVPILEGTSDYTPTYRDPSYLEAGNLYGRNLINKGVYQTGVPVTYDGGYLAPAKLGNQSGYLKTRPETNGWETFVPTDSHYYNYLNNYYVNYRK